MGNLGAVLVIFVQQAIESFRIKCTIRIKRSVFQIVLSKFKHTCITSQTTVNKLLIIVSGNKSLVREKQLTETQDTA